VRRIKTYSWFLSVIKQAKFQSKPFTVHSKYIWKPKRKYHSSKSGYCKCDQYLKICFICYVTFREEPPRSKRVFVLPKRCGIYIKSDIIINFQRTLLHTMINLVYTSFWTNVYVSKLSVLALSKFKLLLPPFRSHETSNETHYIP
jgi:hypothetical protein